MPVLPVQELTVYLDDDTTVNFTVTTESGGSNSYLKFIEKGSSSSIDPLEGSSEIGQINVEVVDVPTDPVNQATGWFTAKLPTLPGRRARVRQHDGDLIWRVLADGPIGDISLDDETLVTYKFSIRDIRDRERRSRMFIETPHTSVFPRGVLNGYGKYTEEGVVKYIVNPVGVYTGVFQVDPNYADYGRVKMNASRTIYTSYTPERREYLHALSGHSVDRTIDPSGQARFFDVTVKWRPVGGTWTTMRNMPWPGGGPATAAPSTRAPAFTIMNGAVFFHWEDYVQVLLSRDSSQPVSLLPADGQTVEIVVFSNLPPSEENPLFIEEDFGVLLKNIYDGMYSIGYPQIRYSAAAMANFITATTGKKARVKITAPVDDMRAWVEEHIYKPLGWAPALNENFEICPIDTALPDASVTLITLNNSNTSKCTWEHDVSDAISRVEFTYKVEYLKLRTSSEPAEIDRIVSDDVVHVFNDVSQAIVGEKELTYEPATVRSIANARFYDIEPLGRSLAEARALYALHRWRYGAQKCAARCMRSDAGVLAAKVGDWVILDVTWVPNYVTLQRGSNRLAQIVGIDDSNPNVREFELIDAGQYTAPAAQPTLGALTFTAEGAVQVPLATLAAGIFAQVEYALAATVPGVNSGEWRFAGFTTSVGIPVYTPIVPDGEKIWVRVRGTGYGRISSAPTAGVSLTRSSAARVSNVRIEFLDTGETKVTWEKNVACLGVRIHYGQRLAASTTPLALGTYVDVDAALLTKTLTLGQLHTHQLNVAQITIVPYVGWTGAAVSGASGEQIATEQQRDDYLFPVMPVLKELMSETTSSGTLTINYVDTQGRIQTMRMRTQAGTGAWSGYTAFALGAAFTLSVALNEKHVSKIAYEISYVAADRTSKTVEKVVTFLAGQKPAVPGLEITINTDGSATAHVTGDSDTQSIKLVFNNGGYPTLAQAQAASAVNGRLVSGTSTGINLAPGGVVGVAALAYSGAGGTGLESDLAFASRVRTGLAKDWPVTGGGKPTIVIARKSVNDTVPAYASGTRLTTLGYDVTVNLTATVAQCKAYGVVVIDCYAWGADEHAAFIEDLLNDGQKVLVFGNDSNTGLWYISSTTGVTPIGTLAKVGTRIITPIDLGWTSTIADGDSGNRIVTVPSYVDTLYNTNENSAHKAVLELQTSQGGRLIHCQPYIVGLNAAADQILSNFVEYLHGTLLGDRIDIRGKRHLGKGDGLELWVKPGRDAVHTLARSLGGVLPNAEFELWNEDGTPHMWNRDLAGGASTAKDTSVKFSGLASLKYINPDTGYHGIDTGFTVPLRAGRSYRVVTAARASRAATRYQVFFYFNAALSLSDSTNYAIAAANTWQTDEFHFTVPTTAEPVSRMHIQFNSMALGATDYWIDSIRIEEDSTDSDFLDIGRPVGWDTPLVLERDVRSGDPAGTRVLTRGSQRGFARNGLAVTFSPVFQNVPVVRLRGGITQEPRSKWGTTGDGTETGAVSADAQYEDLAALSLTASGFTTRARLRQKAAATLRTNNFNADVADAVGETVPNSGGLVLANAPSSTDQYTAQFDLDFEADPFQLTSVEVAVDTRPSAGSWTERGSMLFSENNATAFSYGMTYNNQQIIITVSGLTTTSEIRLRLKSSNSSNASLTGDSTTYYTAADQFASKTPDGDNLIEWEAYEVAG